MEFTKTLIAIAAVVGSSTLALGQSAAWSRDSNSLMRAEVITMTGGRNASATLPRSGTVFTADERGNAISVINPETGQVETTRISISPHNVQTSNDGKKLLAVGSPVSAGEQMAHGHGGPGRVLVFNANAVARGPIGEIEVGPAPAHVIVDPRGKRAFVTISGDNALSVVDLKLRQVVKSITVGKSPHGLRMSPDGRTIYVANTASGTVSVVRVVDLVEVVQIPVGKAPVQVGFTPDGRYCYVSLRDENSTAVIDTVSRQEVAKIPVGPGPIQVFATPNGREVYVANQGTEAAPGNTVSVIGTATRKVVAEIATGAGAHGVVASGNSIFVSNTFADTVSVIDPSIHQVICNIHVGAGPGGITYATAKQ